MNLLLGSVQVTDICKQKYSGKYFFFLVWLPVLVGGLSLGWSLQTIAATLLENEASKHFWETFPFIFQSPLAGFIASFCMVHFFIFFSSLNWIQKTLVTFTAYLGGFTILIITSGLTDEPAYFFELCQCEISTIGPWLPLTSPFQWTSIANFLIGNLVATFFLSLFFQNSRLVISSKPHTVWSISKTGNYAGRLVALFCFLLVCIYTSFVHKGTLPGRDQFLVANYSIGIATGLILTLTSLCFFTYTRKWFRASVCIFLWLSLLTILTISLRLPDSVPQLDRWYQWKYSPSIFTTSFVWLTVISLASQIGIQLNSSSTKTADLSSEKENPNLPDFTVKEPLQTSGNSKKENHFLLSGKKRYSIALSASAFIVVLIGGVFAPRWFDPFVLASTWDFELSTAVAMNRNAAEGKLFTATNDYGDVFREQSIAVPLMILEPTDEKYSFSSGYKLILNVQPLLSGSQKGRSLFKNLHSRAHGLDQVSYLYHENGANGDHFLWMLTNGRLQVCLMVANQKLLFLSFLKKTF